MRDPIPTTSTVGFVPHPRVEGLESMKTVNQAVAKNHRIS